MGHRFRLDRSHKMFPKDKLMLKLNFQHVCRLLLPHVQLVAEQYPKSHKGTITSYLLRQCFLRDEYQNPNVLVVLLQVEFSFGQRYQCVECDRTRNPSGLLIVIFSNYYTNAHWISVRR